MEHEQRLTALPRAAEIRKATQEYTGGYPNAYGEDVVEGRRSLQQYFNIVYKRLPLILALTALVTAGAALYMYKQASQFRAQTEMIIEPRKPKVTSKDSININFGGDTNYYNTQLELLRSPELMRDTVVALGLYRDKNLLGGHDKDFLTSIKSIFSRSNPAEENKDSLPVVTEAPATGEASGGPKLTAEEEGHVGQLVATFSGGLVVHQRERTNIVEVSLVSENPKLAAAVTDKLAETFRDQDARRETQGERKAIEDLEKSIGELELTITGQESELMSNMRSFNLPLQDKGDELAASRLGSLSDTWMKSMEARRGLEARYNAAVSASSRGEASKLPDLYENKIYQDTIRLNTERKAKLQDQIRDIEKQIQDAEAKRRADSTKWMDEHPEMKALLARIESLKDTKTKTEKEVSLIIEKDQVKIEKDAVSGVLVSLRSQLDAARKHESQSLSAYEREAAVANVQGQAQTTMTTLKRSIETNRSLLDTYTQRLKERELSVASEGPENIKISSNAVVPTIPVGPQRSRNIFVAFLFSLAAGIGLAFLMDYLDDSVKTSEDIGRHLGLPTLALIPHHGINDRRKLLATSVSGGSMPAAGLITLEERNSPMAEAYRHLRTSLLFSSAGKPPQTILVTSSQPSEGKTTTAINTAITLAQSDADVVIVDCDLRRPRVHSYFDLENTQGLTNYLSGERNTENLIKSVPGLGRLKVITSGPIPPNPAELLSSNEMKNMLQFLRGKFKHVIIDSPPAISFTDAAILATLVDGVVLVAMANKSSVHLMRRFKTRLASLGARIYGVVLNGIKSGSMEYEYYGAGYYDYYRKGQDDMSTPIMEPKDESDLNG